VHMAQLMPQARELVPTWRHVGPSRIRPIVVARLSHADYCGVTDGSYVVRRVGASHTKAGGAT
jgi:hypothetical protein